MSKKNILNELTNILAIALRHKIGSIVNQEEIYAQRYAKDAEVLLKQVEKVSQEANWNREDKIIIKQILKNKLRQELEKKDFISNKKFDIMDDEMNKALLSLGFY